MAGSKTEKPTDKKKRDAAKKGQTFKGKDLITTCLTLSGVEVVLNFTSLREFSDILHSIVARQYDYSLQGYILQCVWFGIKIFLPIAVLCIAASLLPGLIQTGMRLATKAFKLNFSAINPLKGFKKIFNLRTLKDLIKSLLYLGCFVLATLFFWQENRLLIVSLVWSEPAIMLKAWGQLVHSLLLIFFSCIFVIILIDCVAEYLLYIKELKMDKKEVSNESKEINGNPEIKKKRKALNQELLSEEFKKDIKKSNVVIANPKHIAIGIYLNPAITPIPFISFIEKNQRALAVRHYAEKVGVPVVENISLARELCRTHKKHEFVSLKMFTEVMDILFWLEQVENNWMAEHPDNQLAEVIDDKS
ncbi:EscU/YscU/HrcU family type III secretion system export apparatus switch protein [Winslowiella iniecta]|uniref:Type III secretion system protein SpaS n=1 Tax=Winslowiella iniecta TaxID=1560201 RepID=A0A0L7TGG6_9GAMM|nr:EscU/YscU/HrcU family type III secretion system export apparatus switch protein [Winslowiella iniecta]KOC91605.1 type III secretion system protein SpaS [Winslowiella iniecta]KOC94444.1 type III secretion system protein SpaS [Winslowiella iniecta]